MISLVSDIDGTIYRNKRIENKDLSSIKKFKKKNKLIFATGRNYITFKKLMDSYNFDYDYCILCNGAIILDSNKKIIRNKTFDKKIIKDIYDFIIKYHIDAGLSISYGIEGIYLKDIISCNFFCVYDKIPKKISGICLELNDGEREKGKFLSLINKKFKNLSVEQNNNYFDIVCKSVSKGEAVSYLQKKHIIEEDIAVIGDSDNDLSMLKRFKNSFIIDNADISVKKYAAYEVNSISDCISILGGSNEK